MEQVLKSMTFDFFRKGLHKTTPDQLLGMKQSVFLDVRTNEEAASMPFPLKMHTDVTSLHIPVSELPDRLAEIPRDIPIGVFCPQHIRASMCYAYLRSKGYDQVRVLEGGYAAMADVLKPGKIPTGI